MKSKSNIKLPLTDIEKQIWEKQPKLPMCSDFAPDELAILLNATAERAKEIYALAEFQTVPSIGINLLKTSCFLGYYSLNELKTKTSKTDRMNTN